jgi:plasmid maintenance system antidote protein VapI
MYQEKLIRAIQKRIGAQDSLIERISTALDISYDAAHRRISKKSKFTIEETIRLAQVFGISLDALLENKGHVLVRKTKEIRSATDLSDYLGNSFQALTEYNADEHTSVYYSAKDIPLFYTIGHNLLSKFKLFVWLNLLDFGKGEVSYEDFNYQAPLVDNNENLLKFYSSVQVHEIWNDTTINSTLQQILYFFQSGLLQLDNAVALCDNLTDLIKSLERKCTPKNKYFQMYYHELLILNNNVLIFNGQQRSFFVPYTMLGYFITKDIDTCQNALEFYQHQLKNSVLLNTAGTRDKNIFFNKMYQKIDFYKKQIKSFAELG